MALGDRCDHPAHLADRAERVAREQPGGADRDQQAETPGREQARAQRARSPPSRPRPRRRRAPRRRPRRATPRSGARDPRWRCGASSLPTRPASASRTSARSACDSTDASRSGAIQESPSSVPSGAISVTRMCSASPRRSQRASCGAAPIGAGDQRTQLRRGDLGPLAQRLHVALSLRLAQAALGRDAGDDDAEQHEPGQRGHESPRTRQHRLPPAWADAARDRIACYSAKR